MPNSDAKRLKSALMIRSYLPSTVISEMEEFRQKTNLKFEGEMFFRLVIYFSAHLSWLHNAFVYIFFLFNPLTPELNPSAQRCLKRFFTGDFALCTVHFVKICVKNQQLQQLFFSVY
jgi:hypothetical protein